MRPQIAVDDITQHLSITERLRRLEHASFEDSGWADLPLVAPWVAYDSTNFRARYRRLQGVVYVEGLVTNTTSFSYAGAGSNLLIAQMPVGFRPSMIRVCEGYMVSTAGVFIVLRIDVQPGGSVAILPGNDWSYTPSTGGNNGVASWLKLTIPPFIAD